MEQCVTIITTSRYPVGISTEFCFRWQTKSSRWEGEGDEGGKGKKKKNWGKKLKEKKGRNGKGKKKKNMENRTVIARIDTVDFTCVRTMRIACVQSVSLYEPSAVSALAQLPLNGSVTLI